MSLHLDRGDRGAGGPESIVDLLVVCASVVRLEVLAALGKSALDAGQVARAMWRERSQVSHHFKPLRQAGLVTSSRSGKHLTYRLTAAVRVTMRGGVAVIDLRAADGAEFRAKVPVPPPDKPPPGRDAPPRAGGTGGKAKGVKAPRGSARTPTPRAR
jgi:DNA-binding transcriptional ArsR family regulator